MESMTLMPMAAAQVLDRRALSIVRAPWTIGDMPLASASGHTCTWSHVVTNVNVIATAASAKARFFGTKAYGTRRLGEHAST